MPTPALYITDRLTFERVSIVGQYETDKNIVEIILPTGQKRATLLDGMVSADFASEVAEIFREIEHHRAEIDGLWTRLNKLPAPVIGQPPAANVSQTGAECQGLPGERE